MTSRNNPGFEISGSTSKIKERNFASALGIYVIIQRDCPQFEI